MEKPWHYIENQFINATDENYEKAVKLSNYHDADLNTKKATQPLLVAIYNRYHPLHLTLVSEYNAWKSAGGSQKGKTAGLKILLKSTYEQMPAWDVQVQTQFLPGTEGYISIFPNGRAPFITGSIDDKINAYDTLARNMEPYAALDPTRAEITAAYTALDTARDTQEGSKGTVKVSSGKVEDARIAAMTMQYRNLGFAMDNFTDDTAYIESMFDLATLRDAQQTHFTGTLDPSETKHVATRTMLEDDVIKAKSNGNANIKLYLASTQGGINSTAVEILANEERTFTAADFGAIDFGTHRFLTVVNQSVSEETQFIIDLE